MNKVRVARVSLMGQSLSSVCLTTIVPLSEATATAERMLQQVKNGDGNYKISVEILGDLDEQYIAAEYRSKT